MHHYAQIFFYNLHLFTNCQSYLFDKVILCWVDLFALCKDCLCILYMLISFLINLFINADFFTSREQPLVLLSITCLNVCKHTLFSPSDWCNKELKSL